VKKKTKRPTTIELATIRQAVGDYMQSEGCSCCSDTEAHRKHKKRLAALLNVPIYRDGSGFDFERFCTKAR
jgi:hypothetical protein